MAATACSSTQSARTAAAIVVRRPLLRCLQLQMKMWQMICLRYLTLKEVFWYELPRTLRGLTVGVRRLYLPSGVMNQVSDTKNRVVKA